MGTYLYITNKRRKEKCGGLFDKHQTDMAYNVFGEPLLSCGTEPMTGFYRDGCCETGEDDLGAHTVCAVLSGEFLLYSKSRGNDLTTPIPLFDFPGLKEGDHWCLCAAKWMEAYYAGVAPKIILEATHEKTLEYISLQELVLYGFR
jgi:uncharacterized protein (DUF2237 family)